MIGRILGLGFVLAVAGPLQAADHGPLDDNFYLGLGGFAFSADTELRLDGQGGRGTSIDWERDLGLPDDEDSFRLDAFWRFADRHKLRLVYFRSKRTASRTLDEDFTIAGEVFPVNAVVEASVDTGILELAYEYAFMKRQEWELAVTAGVHYTQIEPALQITGSVGNADVEVGREGKAEADMPLPVFGLRGMWHLGRNFYLDAHAQYFYLSLDGNDGSLSDLRAALTWNPRSWFGLGVGYNRFTSDLDVDIDSFDGEMEWSYSGPQIFYVATF